VREAFNNMRALARATGVLAVIGVAALSGGFAYHVYMMSLPDPTRLGNSSQIGCSGKVRSFVPLGRIPHHLRDALLAAEEPNFFKRPQINVYWNAANVLFTEISHSPKQFHGSSISGSVVRCLLHAHRERWRNGDWHIASVVLLHRIERALDRERIFETFANDMYFGRKSYGLAAASEAYFAKPLDELSLAEAAMIAAGFRSPGALERPDEALNLRNSVLDRMAQQGFITREIAETAKGSPANFVSP
jgi:penicillin-binding protein 1A